tara:strand:+ start:156 stop:371 length:216 start_codon:yes stop_codon:yes gene_type:complete
MKMFTQVYVPDSKNGMDYIKTAEVNDVASDVDPRPGPYYFIQEVKKGTGNKTTKANFKRGRFYNHKDVILA